MSSNNLTDKKNTKHAIVCGGGFSGLLAGRVLANYFETVTIIEKDPLPETNFSPRKGVPQSNQIHVLMPIGAKLLNQFFPKLEAMLLQHGARKIELANNWRYYFLGWKPTFKNGKYTYLQTRSLLEGSIRSLMSDYANIKFIYDSEVSGILTDFNEKKLTGVQITHCKSQETSNLYGDIIVDALGRNTNFPIWLEALNYSPPEKNEIQIDLMYVSRLYRLPPSLKLDWNLMLIKSAAPKKKKGGMMQVEDDKEGNRWLVTLAGQWGEFPPTDDAGFVEFARQVEQPDVYDLIKQSTPLSPCMPFKFNTIRRYFYEKATNLPKGFFAIGDALNVVSPVYGIGLSVCAQIADVLNNVMSECKREDLRVIQNNYFQQSKKILDNVWAVNVNQEYLFPETQGKRPFGFYALNGYRNILLEMCTNNPQLWQLMSQVIDLEVSALTLFKPSLFFRAMLYAMKRSVNKR